MYGGVGNKSTRKSGYRGDERLFIGLRIKVKNCLPPEAEP